MVHEQGEIVDSIEQNIESTTVQVGTFFDPSSDYRGDVVSKIILQTHCIANIRR